MVAIVPHAHAAALCLLLLLHAQDTDHEVLAVLTCSFTAAVNGWLYAPVNKLFIIACGCLCHWM